MISSGKCFSFLFCQLTVTSAFENLARLNQEVKISGRSNVFFKRGLKGLQNVLSFVNLKWTQASFVSFYDNTDTSLTTSTPLITEPGRNLFNTDDSVIPDNLPAYLALSNKIKKKLSLYTMDNNILVKKKVIKKSTDKKNDE
jgi:hypothetical protein